MAKYATLGTTKNYTEPLPKSFELPKKIKIKKRPKTEIRHTKIRHIETTNINKRPIRLPK